jgi:hypothetical protein
VWLPRIFLWRPCASLGALFLDWAKAEFLAHCAAGGGEVGFARIVALRCRPSTSYQVY